MLKTVVLVFLLVLTTVGQVEADSDGYFCSGDGYLMFDQIGSDGSRIFKVVFFSDRTGVSEPHQISIAYFQTHGLKCETKRVVVAGWKESYIIDLGDGNSISWEKKEGVTHSTTDNLGLWAKEGEHQYTLNATGSKHSFTLFVTKETKTEPAPGGAREDIRVVSKLIHRDTHGKVISSKVLLDLTDQRGID